VSISLETPAYSCGFIDGVVAQYIMGMLPAVKNSGTVVTLEGVISCVMTEIQMPNLKQIDYSCAAVDALTGK
jgi:ribosomal protein L10